MTAEENWQPGDIVLDTAGHIWRRSAEQFNAGWESSPSWVLQGGDDPEQPPGPLTPLVRYGKPVLDINTAHQVNLLWKIHADLSAIRAEEAEFAIAYAKRLDEIRHLIKVTDQRHAVLDVTHGRLDGLRIALETIAELAIAERNDTGGGDGAHGA
jgi:hypothetical protein